MALRLCDEVKISPPSQQINQQNSGRNVEQLVSSFFSGELCETIAAWSNAHNLINRNEEKKISEIRIINALLC